MGLSKAQSAIEIVTGGEGTVITIRKTNASSTTKAIIITPAATLKVRIISVSIDFAGTTSNGLEIYFGDSTNITSDLNNAIFEARQAAIGPVAMVWPPGHGPVGDAGEVVDIRGTASVAENVNCIITYMLEG